MAVKNNDYNSSISAEEKQLLNNMASTYSNKNFANSVYNDVIKQKSFENEISDPNSAISQVLANNGGKITLSSEDLKIIFADLHEKNNDSKLVGLQPITITNNNLSNDRVAEFYMGNQLVAWIDNKGAYQGKIGNLSTAEIEDIFSHTVTIDYLERKLTDYISKSQIIDPVSGKIMVSMMPLGTDVADTVKHMSDTDIHVTKNEKTDWNNKYTKPAMGIPEGDLCDSVIAKLNPKVSNEVLDSMITQHANDTVSHVSLTEKNNWNNSASKIDSIFDTNGSIKGSLLGNVDFSPYDKHVADSNVHVTMAEKNIWNDKYNLPATGIPKTDLDANLQYLLDSIPTNASINNWNDMSQKIANILDTMGRVKNSALQFNIDDYAKKTDIPSLAGYVTQSDLTDYAKKTDIPSLADYVTQTYLGNVLQNYSDNTTLNNTYAKISDLPNMSLYTTSKDLEDNYAKKTDIPSLVGYLTQNDLTTALMNYTDTATLQSTYASKNDLLNYTDTATLQSTYALKSDIPSLTGYATQTDLLDYAKIADLPNFTDFVNKTDLNTSLGSYATQTWVTNQGYLTNSNLTDYLLKNDILGADGMILPSLYSASADVDTTPYDNHIADNKIHLSDNDVAKLTNLDNLMDNNGMVKDSALSFNINDYVKTVDNDHTQYDNHIKDTNIHLSADQQTLLTSLSNILDSDGKVKTSMLGSDVVTDTKLTDTLADYDTKTETDTKISDAINDYTNDVLNPTLADYSTTTDMTDAINTAVADGTANLVDKSTLDDYATKKEMEEMTVHTTTDITVRSNIGLLQAGTVIPAGSSFDDVIKLIATGSVSDDIQGDVKSILYGSWDTYANEDNIIDSIQNAINDGSLSLSSFASTDELTDDGVAGAKDITITFPEGKTQIILIPDKYTINKMNETTTNDPEYISLFVTGKVTLDGQTFNCFAYSVRTVQESVDVEIEYI